MDQYSVSGGQKQSSCGSHLDFANYWSDQTVKEAVLQGQLLRQEKTHLSSKRNDVMHIDFIKLPRTLKDCGHHRNKAPKSPNKRQRSRSPAIQGKSSSNMAKRQKCQKSKKAPCGMRIAELAVPTKRQLLETWKNKYNILPAYMIERLQQHIMDQRPIVQISDAIYCFKKKCKKERNTEKTIDKTTRSKHKKIKKSMRINEVKPLSVVFGHKIARKLNNPLNIVLNSNLEKIANIVSYEIANLMCKSRNIDMNNKINKSIHRDITNKVTIWVSDILDESTYKILEDQLRDFEEEAGPVLDVIDDMVDGVLNICVPKPEVFEEPSSSESDEAGLEKDILESHTYSENVVLEDAYESENIEDHLKKEIITIINNFEKDDGTKSEEYLDTDDGLDWQAGEVFEEKETMKNVANLNSEDITFEQIEDAEASKTDIKDDEYLETEGDVENQPSENAEANDDDIQNDEYLETEEVIASQLSESTAAKNVDVQDREFLETGEIVTLQQSEDAETKEIDLKTGQHFDPDDGAQKNEITEIPLEDTDNITESFALQQSEDAETKEIDVKTDEYLDPDDGVQKNEITEVPLEDTNNITESFALQQSEDAETKEIDVKTDEYLDPDDGAQNNEITEVPLEDTNNITESFILQQSEDAETKEIDLRTDEYLDPDDGIQKNEITEVPLEDTDNITESFTDATEKNDDEEKPTDKQTDDIGGVSETLSDENNKKVTFNELVKENVNTEQKSDVEVLDWKTSVDRMDFAAPNEDLLSDADESWPEEIQPPVIRPSQSVSKSITSLGNINEDEEKASTPLEDSGAPQERNNHVEINSQNIVENIRFKTEETKSPADDAEKYGDKIDDTLVKKEDSVDESVKANKTAAFRKSEKTKTKKRESITSESKKVKPTEKAPLHVAKIKKSSRPNKTKIETSPRPMKPIQTKKIKKRTSISKVNSKDIESTRISQSVNDLSEYLNGSICKAKDDKFSSLRVKPKLNYRVNMQTAPPWVNRRFGEPRCSYVNISSKNEVKSKWNENEIRKWCRDLEQGYENLNMWNEWINNTCRTVCILQKQINDLDAPKRCINKELIKLKRNLDKDAFLWRKLAQSTRDRLKYLKEKYQKRSEIPSNYNIICCSQPR